MYNCPYCGKELTADSVYVESIQGCRLSDTYSRVEFIGGKERGSINWDGLYDACRDSNSDTRFTCRECGHELTQEEVEDLILINSKKKS